MADRQRLNGVGVHELVIRVRLDEERGGIALTVEAPACGCEAAPPGFFVGMLVDAITGVVTQYGGTSEPGEAAEPPTLVPTQRPGRA